MPGSFYFFLLSRYMELVHTDNNFEPEESFFQLFSDPRSTRLTRVQLREDVVRDKDLEAIRKQVGCCKPVFPVCSCCNPGSLQDCCYYTCNKAAGM